MDERHVFAAGIMLDCSESTVVVIRRLASSVGTTCEINAKARTHCDFTSIAPRSPERASPTAHNPNLCAETLVEGGLGTDTV